MIFQVRKNKLFIIGRLLLLLHVIFACQLIAVRSIRLFVISHRTEFPAQYGSCWLFDITHKHHFTLPNRLRERLILRSYKIQAVPLFLYCPPIFFSYLPRLLILFKVPRSVGLARKNKQETCRIHHYSISLAFLSHLRTVDRSFLKSKLLFEFHFRPLRQIWKGTTRFYHSILSLSIELSSPFLHTKAMSHRPTRILR